MAKLKDLVAIERKGKLERVHGFLLAKAKEWLLVERESEFKTDGFRLIRRKDVKIIRHNAADALHQPICKMMGEFQVLCPRFLSLTQKIFSTR